ncbi:MAG: class I SAM-dependent rRNA methyltransferase [Pseudomonadota bacterium]
MTPLYLRRGAERRLRSGHLWVYSNEVDTARSPLSQFAAGDLVQVVNGSGQLIGSAFAEPSSLICARLYWPGEVRSLDEDLFTERLEAALAVRERLFDEPFYRLVYGDSDLLPGVVVDRYDAQLVVQLNSLSIEHASSALVNALKTTLSPEGILLRRDSRARREQDGRVAPEVVHGDVPELVQLRENGVQFQVPVYSGQKTGWFYDHRSARARASELSRGGSLLDVYSYIGGWGVQAAARGATEVVCVDSSLVALEQVAANAALNGCEASVSTRHGQASEVMADLVASGRRFDAVVLDPPAFIQRRKDLKKGISAYRRINELALRLLSPGGLLVSASCSMQLSRTDLIGAIQQAAQRVGCGLRIVEQYGQGPDHPVHPAIPETEYLKSVFALRR